MNTADQTDLPLDQIGIIGAGENDEELATDGTSPLVCRQIVEHFFRGKLMATSSAIPLRPRLLASFASFLGSRGEGFRDIRVAVVRFRGDVLGLFGLSPKHLLPQPRQRGHGAGACG